MIVKDRRADIRLKLIEKEPVEIEKICSTITSERLKEMQKRLTQLEEKRPRFSEKEKDLLTVHFPELLDDVWKAEDTLNAQTIRWVHDELSPVDWLGSDADMACEYYLSKLFDLKDAIAFC